MVDVKGTVHNIPTYLRFVFLKEPTNCHFCNLLVKCTKPNDELTIIFIYHFNQDLVAAVVEAKAFGLIS